MAKNEVDQVTDDTIKSGGVLTRMYFDMQSPNAEELQPIMVDLVNNRLLKSQGVVYCSGSIEEPIKVSDVYSTSATVTVLFKNLISLVNVVFNFSPAGIEILKPEKDFMIRISELQSLLINLSQVSADYSQYILSRVLSKEDYQKVLLDIKNREELGKKLIDKKKE
jgi:hypothetical protein